MHEMIVNVQYNKWCSLHNSAKQQSLGSSCCQLSSSANKNSVQWCPIDEHWQKQLSVRSNVRTKSCWFMDWMLKEPSGSGYCQRKTFCDVASLWSFESDSVRFPFYARNLTQCLVRGFFSFSSVLHVEKLSRQSTMLMSGCLTTIVVSFSSTQLTA